MSEREKRGGEKRGSDTFHKLAEDWHDFRIRQGRHDLGVLHDACQELRGHLEI